MEALTAARPSEVKRRQAILADEEMCAELVRVAGYRRRWSETARTTQAAEQHARTAQLLRKMAGSGGEKCRREILRLQARALVLLCQKSSLAFTRRQHGHRGSVLSKAAAISSRKVVMDDGTWRCVRWATARLVMRG